MLLVAMMRHFDAYFLDAALLLPLLHITLITIRHAITMLPRCLRIFERRLSLAITLLILPLHITCYAIFTPCCYFTLLRHYLRFTP